MQIIFQNFPLPSHTNSDKAAEAALCAHDQGKFWEYHDKLFENRPRFDPSQLKGYAKDLALDAAAFDACLDDGKYRERVQTQAKHGADLGVRSTPTFFVNGRLITGAQPFEAFQQLIDEELELAAAR